jgi:hypothetical protein
MTLAVGGICSRRYKHGVGSFVQPPTALFAMTWHEYELVNLAYPQLRLLPWPMIGRDDKNRIALITPEQLIEFRTSEVMGKILSGEKFDLGVPPFPV